MKKIHVSICTGTTCYLMGAAHLLTLDEVLDPVSSEYVEISGAHCLGLCNDPAQGKAPFVKVNDHIIADATLTKVIEKIRELMLEEEE